MSFKAIIVTACFVLAVSGRLYSMPTANSLGHYDFTPNTEVDISNPLFFKISASCDLKMTDASDDFSVIMKSGSATVNGQAVDNKAAKIITVKSGDKLSVTASGEAKVSITNKGKSLVHADCGLAELNLDPQKCIASIMAFATAIEDVANKIKAKDYMGAIQRLLEVKDHELKDVITNCKQNEGINLRENKTQLAIKLDPAKCIESLEELYTAAMDLVSKVKSKDYIGAMQRLVEIINNELKAVETNCSQ